MTAFMALIAFMTFLGAIIGSYFAVTTLLWWNDYRANKAHAKRLKGQAKT